MQTNDDIINLVAVYCRGFDNQKIEQRTEWSAGSQYDDFGW